MSDDVFLKLEYGALDVIRGMRLRLATRLRGRRAFAVGVVLAGFVCIALLLLLYPRAPAWARLLGVWLVILATVHGAFTALKAVPHVMFRAGTVDRRAMPARGDFWSRKMSVDASDEGIIVTVGQRSATLKWRDCARLESDPRSHVVYHGAQGFLVVPRRAFRTEKQDTSFRDLASRHIGQVTEDRPRPPPPVPADAEPVDAETSEATAAVAAATSRAPKVGRNDPCPCGSGKKHKKCCLGVPRLP